MLEPRFPVARPLRLGLWLGSIAAVGFLLSGFAGCQGPDTFLRKPGSGAGGASHGVGGSSFGTGGHGTGGTFGTGGSGVVDASGPAAHREPAVHSAQGAPSERAASGARVAQSSTRAWVALNSTAASTRKRALLSAARATLSVRRRRR